MADLLENVITAAYVIGDKNVNIYEILAIQRHILEIILIE